jgi:hypothetical protein
VQLQLWAIQSSFLHVFLPVVMNTLMLSLLSLTQVALFVVLCCLNEQVDTLKKESNTKLQRYIMVLCSLKWEDSTPRSTNDSAPSQADGRSAKAVQGLAV